MQAKYRVLLIIATLVLFAGCSTEKNTPVTRAYHNLTAFYNIYFNGQQSLREGVERYEQQYEDDYSQLLPVFIYGEPAIHQSIKPQMERVVEKASKAIRLHSITAKPDAKQGRLSQADMAFYNQSEYNKYVDDSYLLIAKALFYQMDYVASTKTLEYILSEYSDSSLLVDARIWLSRAYMEREDYNDVASTLKSIEEDKLTNKQKTEYCLTYGAFYLRRSEYSQAEKWLERALEDLNDRRQAQRVNYILGQLAVEAGETKLASQHFEQVLKLRPPYYMEFNANIQVARLSTGGNTKEMIGRLRKMLRDDKNRDYQDQIYYALGQIYLRNNNRAKAVEHFKKAAYYSVQNKNQKGLAYLSLAQLYFEHSEYRNAQAYYDSAVTSLEKDYPGYADLYRKNENLTDLVTNLIQVETQDSLLQLAALPEAERKTVVNKMIASLRAQDKQKEERIRSRGGFYSPGQSRQLRTQGGDDQGKWYFYNPNAKSFGEPEFKRRWGERTLEDNWRRRDKQVVAFADDLTEEQAAAQMEEQLKKEERYNPENYLKNIPLTDSAKLHAEFLIREGLYNAAHVYYAQLDDTESAVSTFEELLARYKAGAYVLPTHYQLYSIFTQQDKPSKAEHHKQIIINKFSDTRFAEVLRNPDYFQKYKEQEKLRQKAYEQTLENYQEGHYSRVIAASKEALEKPLLGSFHPKYAYLMALSKGKLQGNAVLIQALEKVAQQYPTDQVAKQSEELIAFVQRDELQKTRNDISTYQKEAARQQLSATEEELAEAPVVNAIGKYRYKPDALHYFVLVVGKQVNLNQLRFNLINFNLDYYLQEDYNVSERQLNEYSQLLVVKRFEELAKARDYFFTFDAKQELVFDEVAHEGYQYFIISVDNYMTLTAERSISDYIDFFRQTYLSTPVDKEAE